MKKMFSLIIVLVSIICCDKVFAYKEYKIGDKVTYRGEEYYLIEEYKDFITVLKKEPLTKDEVNKYNGGEYISENGEMPFFLQCDSIAGIQCFIYSSANYDNSDLHTLIDNWSLDKLNIDDLVNINGYSARLITLDELRENFSYEFDYSSDDGRIYKNSQNTPEWLYEYSYWTMNGFEDNYKNVWMIETSGKLVPKSFLTKSMIRPVINLKKDALIESNLCLNKEYKIKKVTKFKHYQKSDEIEYRGEKYYVMENSNSEKEYVTLLKANPLTYYEIEKNKGNLMMNYSEDNDGIGLIPYYSSNKCNSSNISDCTTDFNNSNIRIVIDNWSSEFEDDLVSVNGYKARIITIDDLFDKLNYTYRWIVTHSAYAYTEYTPEWAYNKNISCWTMTPFEDSNTNIYVNSDLIVTRSVFDLYAVRPIINLNKCAIDGGCYEEEIQIVDGCVEDNNVIDNNNSIVGNDNKTVVNVENTLKVISKIIFILSTILIIGGTAILGYNYIKSKNERK